jgi:hypothetical protein
VGGASRSRTCIVEDLVAPVGKGRSAAEKSQCGMCAKDFQQCRNRTRAIAVSMLHRVKGTRRKRDPHAFQGPGRGVPRAGCRPFCPARRPPAGRTRGLAGRGSALAIGLRYRRPACRSAAGAANRPPVGQLQVGDPDEGVKVVGTFPENTHPPIIYPIAAVAASTNPGDAGYIAYLRSPAARRVCDDPPACGCCWHRN